MKSTDSLAIVILAAGKGTRMKSALPKVMHPLAGRPLIGWIVETAELLNPEKIVVVTGPGMEALADEVAPHDTAVQAAQKGTGDAVRAALPSLKGFTGDVLILLGDMPLISAGTLRALIEARHEDAKTGLAVLGAEYDAPPAFGRLVLNKDGSLAKIVEDADASPAEKQIRLCNTGAFCVDGEKLESWLGRIKTDNAQGEYYVTDLPAMAAQDGYKTAVSVAPDLQEVMGVNSRLDLAQLERAVQDRLRLEALAGGATLHDPASVYFSWDTELGQDVVVEPHVVFGPAVSIAEGVTVKAFSHLEGVRLEKDAQAGPFARLRPGTHLEEGAKVGNFVEVKNAHVGKKSKINHLSYIGDAQVGDSSNIGAGTITCNYDGFDKFRTEIGAGVFVGSNSTLVAPVSIADGAYVAAGSVVTENVPEDALVVARSRPALREGWAKLFRNRKKKQKESA